MDLIGRGVRLTDGERGDVHGWDRRPSGGGARLALGFDRGAVRDRRHAYDRGALGRVGGPRNGHPQARLEVDADGLVRQRDVGDGLQVGNAVQEDVALLPRAPVGHRGAVKLDTSPNLKPAGSDSAGWRWMSVMELSDQAYRIGYRHLIQRLRLRS